MKSWTDGLGSNDPIPRADGCDWCRMFLAQGDMNLWHQWVDRNHEARHWQVLCDYCLERDDALCGVRLPAWLVRQGHDACSQVINATCWWYAPTNLRVAFWRMGHGTEIGPVIQ